MGPIAHNNIMSGEVKSPKMVKELPVWGVKEVQVGRGGRHKVFRFSKSLAMDLEQLLWAVEELLRCGVDTGKLPRGFNRESLVEGRNVLEAHCVYGLENLYGIEVLRFESVIDGEWVRYRNFLYGVWMKCTNKRNLLTAPKQSMWKTARNGTRLGVPHFKSGSDEPHVGVGTLVDLATGKEHLIPSTVVFVEDSPLDHPDDLKEGPFPPELEDQDSLRFVDLTAFFSADEEEEEEDEEEEKKEAVKTVK